jgi:hypothetical protein
MTRNITQKGHTKTMDLRKLINTEIEVVTTAPVNTYNSHIDGDGDKKQTIRTGNWEGAIEGTLKEATPDHLLIESQYRGRNFNYRINPAHVVYILTSSLNESGIAQSERMKAVHAKK